MFQEITDWSKSSDRLRINRLNPSPYLWDVSEMIFTEGKHLFEKRTFENSSFSEVSIPQERFEKNPNFCAVSQYAMYHNSW